MTEKQEKLNHEKYKFNQKVNSIISIQKQELSEHLDSINEILMRFKQTMNISKN